MNKACWTAVLTVGLVNLAFCGAVRAADSGDDFDPANPPAGFWNNNGLRIGMPKIDSYGNFQVCAVLRFWATTNLIAGHDKDSGGTKHAHVHYSQDYDSVGDANRYYDKVFGASDSPKKTDRVTGTNATNLKNCHAYALPAFIGTGIYNYWLEPPDNALIADTEGKDKKTVQKNDLLYYGSHTTGVQDATAGTTSNTITKLRWKAGYSGVYDYSTSGFDTPKYKIKKLEPGYPVELGPWDPAGMGSESALIPSGQVRRKKA